MKCFKFLIVSLTLVLLTGCYDAKVNKPTVSLIKVANGLTKNETYRLNSDSSILEPHHEYRGSFEDGTIYIISKYNSGSVAGRLIDKKVPLKESNLGLGKYLLIDCNVEIMTDELLCRTSTHYMNEKRPGWDVNYGFNMTSNGFNFPYNMCIGFHDFPGRIAKVRFDSDSSISLGETGCTNNKTIIKKIFSSKRIRTEYAHWPNGIRLNSMVVPETNYFNDIMMRMSQIYKLKN